VKVRLLVAPIVAALSLSLAQAQEPARLPVAQTNQQLADSIAAGMTANSVAQGADVTIIAEKGTVTLTGVCKDAAQKNAILEQVRVVQGVKLVKDGLTAGAITQVRAQDTPPAQLPAVGPRVSTPVFETPVNVMPSAPGVYSSGPMVEPTPVGGAGYGAMEMGGAPLPGHAWPTYAPYPNMSRVAYPTAHAYGDFPFIGPYYPFPKVPLGWRSVSLTWNDGHWFIGRKSTSYDYWRVKFW
jgi:hypothetical protein